MRHLLTTLSAAMAIGLTNATTYVLKPSAYHSPSRFNPRQPRRRFSAAIDLRGQDLCVEIRRAKNGAAIDRLLHALKASGNARQHARGERLAVRRRHELGARPVVRCAGVAEGEVVLCAATASLPELVNGALPHDIQWMPPGRNDIMPTEGGEVTPMTINATEATAQLMQSVLARAIAAAQAGNGDLPYFDFNHEDAEASAHPTQFYWGGDDQKTGGVRAKVQWTKAGETAVLGRTYRRFSPAFHRTGETVTGAPTNMGGLVNRAAFRRIAPILSKGSDAEDGKQKPTNQQHSMKSLLAVLAKLGVITSADLDEASAVAQAQANISSLQGERDTVKAKAGTLETENASLKTKVDGLEKQVKDQATVHAKAHYAECVKAGKFAPSDKDSEAFWLGQLEANFATAVKALEAIPANPALATEPVVQAKEGGATTQAKPGDEPHVTKAKAWGKATGKTGDTQDLVVAYFDANPGEYDTYRKGLNLGKPQ